MTLNCTHLWRESFAANIPRLHRVIPAAILLLLVAASCKSAPTEQDPILTSANECELTHCVLFIGGSLTYENDTPGILEALTHWVGGTISIGTSYMGGSTLGDHLDAGNAALLIKSRQFDIVVLEQGPSARADSRILLRQWTAQFNTIIRAAGGTPALSMTWPTRENIADFPASSESYRLAAQDVKGILLPIGDAWRAAWRRDANIELYGVDGWHPALNASYLGALVMHGRLYNRSVIGMPSDFTLESGTPVHIDARVALILQQAADEVNGR